MRADIRSIHTIVPSTTSAAITAFGTGARPGATNMVGFSVAYGDGVMNLLAMEGWSRAHAVAAGPHLF